MIKKKSKKVVINGKAVEPKPKIKLWEQKDYSRKKARELILAKQAKAAKE